MAISVKTKPKAPAVSKQMVVAEPPKDTPKPTPNKQPNKPDPAPAPEPAPATKTSEVTVSLKFKAQSPAYIDVELDGKHASFLKTSLVSYEIADGMAELVMPKALAKRRGLAA